MHNEPVPARRLFSTNRLEALSDAIFAFAMTLLVLNLGFPDSVTGDATSRLSVLLAGHINQFINYAIGFILIAIFWIAHHQQYHLIKKADSRLIWINIAMLMFVALMPFSTDLVGDFNGQVIAVVFFACNLLIVGLLLMLGWAYAIKNKKLIDEEVDLALIKKITRRNFLTPAISVVVIILAFYVPGHSLLAYLLVPLAYLLKPFR
jgi:uncharacterized membrane protein